MLMMLTMMSSALSRADQERECDRDSPFPHHFRSFLALHSTTFGHSMLRCHWIVEVVSARPNRGQTLLCNVTTCTLWHPVYDLAVEASDPDTMDKQYSMFEHNTDAASHAFR
jgi:hypothetical protein